MTQFSEKCNRNLSNRADKAAAAETVRAEGELKRSGTVKKKPEQTLRRIGKNRM